MKCCYKAVYKDKSEKSLDGTVKSEDKDKIVSGMVMSIKDFIHKVANPKFEYEFLMSKLEGRVKFDEEGRFCSLDKMGKTSLEITAEIIEEEKEES